MPFPCNIGFNKLERCCYQSTSPFFQQSHWVKVCCSASGDCVFFFTDIKKEILQKNNTVSHLVFIFFLKKSHLPLFLCHIAWLNHTPCAKMSPCTALLKKRVKNQTTLCWESPSVSFSSTGRRSYQSKSHQTPAVLPLLDLQGPFNPSWWDHLGVHTDMCLDTNNGLKSQKTKLSKKKNKKHKP